MDWKQILQTSRKRIWVYYSFRNELRDFYVQRFTWFHLSFQISFESLIHWFQSVFVTNWIQNSMIVIWNESMKAMITVFWWFCRWVCLVDKSVILGLSEVYFCEMFRVLAKTAPTVRSVMNVRFLSSQVKSEYLGMMYRHSFL